MKLLIQLTDYFKRFLTNSSKLQLEPGAHALATWNELNRRKNTRIKYSHIGAVGDLPKVFYMDEEMGVGNISVGGLLIIDDLDKMGGEVGTIVNLQLAWPDETKTLRARIVGAQLSRRHVQFVDFQPDTFQRISRLIAAGFVGSKCHQVRDSQKLMDALEFWVGPTGEYIHFPRLHENGLMTKLSFHNRALIIPTNSRPYFEDRGEVIHRSHLSELLVFLANLPEPTERIKTLIEHLQDHFKLTPKVSKSRNEVA